MKRIYIILIILAVTLTESMSIPLPSPVVIVEDRPAREFGAAQMAKMTKQLIAAKKQIDEARKLVRFSNTMVQIAGDPKSVIKSMADLASASRQLDQIFGTPTTREFRKLVFASESLSRSQEYFDKEVRNSFLSGKKQIPRKANLYRVYALAEASYDSFEKLIEVDRSIQKTEARRQETLSRDLVNAKTQAEVDKINAAIAASKSAQDASSQQIAKQKMEIDVQKMAIETEREKVKMAYNEEKLHELTEAERRLLAREELQKEAFNERVKDTIFVPSQLDVI